MYSQFGIFVPQMQLAANQGEDYSQEDELTGKVGQV